MIFLNPRIQKTIVLSCDLDKPENEQTKFLIGPLTIADENIMKDAAWVRVGDKIKFSLGQKHFWAIQVGLRDVINLPDGIEFKREKVAGDYGIHMIPSSFLERMPANMREELANAIIATTEIESDTAKN